MQNHWCHLVEAYGGSPRKRGRYGRENAGSVWPGCKPCMIIGVPERFTYGCYRRPASRRT